MEVMYVFQPVSLQLDVMSDRLYWIDSTTNSIHFIRLDAEFPAKVFTVYQGNHVSRITFTTLSH